MRVIHKETVELAGLTFIPLNAEILSVQKQGNNFQCWYITEVGDSTHYAQRCLAVYGTGQPAPTPDFKFVATVQDGPFVWHIFDAGRLL